MNSMDYKNSPLAPLTAILDHFTNSLCGYDYLKMKYVAFGYNILAVFAGCVYFYTKQAFIISFAPFSAIFCLPFKKNLYLC